MAELKNDFSWSKSRDAIFRECPRRYFFQYYGSWGGWYNDAEPRTRKLYVLRARQKVTEAHLPPRRYREHGSRQ